MLLTYRQSTGELSREDGSVVAVGWAGCGKGKNNPAMDDVRCVGPLPAGLYRVRARQDHPRLGKDVCALDQVQGESHGRNDFWIHGPSLNPLKYGQESMGCIILKRPDRLKVLALNPAFLRVIA